MPTRNILLATLLCPSVCLLAQPAPAPPDIIFFHGNILTGSHLRPDDPSSTPPRVSAIAVSHGIIQAVGPDSDILKLKSNKTKLIDLNGAFAMPGFNDAHTHLYSAGFQKKLSVDLDGTHSLAEMQQRIKAYLSSAKSGTWIQGAGWDHTLWPGKILPTRTDIDAVTGSHPAIFFRTDGHILVANSAALAAAGISASTPNPAGGTIDRDSSGNPNGIIRETPATSLIEAKIPPPSEEQRRTAILAAIDDALAHGVTSVQDYSPEWANFLLLETLENTGKLHLRISEWMDFNLPIPVLEERRASHPADDPLLHLGMLKGFMDGSLGSRTAAMESPYSDEPDTSGIPRYQQDRLNSLAASRASVGFQLGFHAIGDAANTMALNAFEAAEQVAQPAPMAHPDASIVTRSSASSESKDLRFRIEHAQVLAPGDFTRFEQLGVIASMQPSHLLTDMNWAEARLGSTRVLYSYAWKTFLNHHVILAFGTDYPVESINPFRGLYSAITRQNETGTQTYQPQERISLQEAIYAYTQASAYAEFREHSKGRLEAGYLADLIVVDRDITAVAPQQLLHSVVTATYLAGQPVYSSGTPSGSPPEKPSR